MEPIRSLIDVADVLRGVPAVLVLVGLIGIGIFLRARFRRSGSARSDSRFGYQMSMLVLTLVFILSLLLFLPIDQALRGQLLGFLGVLLSAVLALSSTSILGNMLAGFMLRAQSSFRPGDFLEVEEHLGRITERGLFHTEIQNEKRDLTSLPNLYLASRPFTVFRSTGTLVNTTVSLGYDVHRKHAQDALLRGATAAGLEDPFVRILSLGDFSVSYRVSGLLREVKQLVSARTRLNARVLDALHETGIEIVSPTFMNQRRIDATQRFLPDPTTAAASDEGTNVSERLMFDKAEDAGSIEELRDRLKLAEQSVQELEKVIDELDGAEREAFAARLEQAVRLHEGLASQLERAEQEG